MIIRLATMTDAPGMAQVMVDTWLTAHRGQVPEGQWQRRRQEWSYADSERSWRRLFAEIEDGSNIEDCPYVAYWRRGYATEAIKLVARFYFRELGYQKLTSLVYNFNERSLQMHEKFGFVFEGRLRRTAYTNGRHYDTIVFGMTSEEFDRLDPVAELWEDKRYQMNLVEGHKHDEQ
ncbi:MAG: GNAT family N-acetyltransferase [Caldilineaceae bacterium]